MMADARRSYTIVDVFTDTPLEGNPVAVFDDGTGLDEPLMQRIARELNLSETVFVLPPSGAGFGAGSASADARVRIFTPYVELPFAGHPVLGTAFVLGGSSGEESVALETGAGVVPVALRRSGSEVVYGEMEQPIPVPEPFEETPALLSGLGVEASELPVQAYRNGPVFVYVALADEAAVASLSPDLGALSGLPGLSGVSVFAGAGDRWKTRMFGPGVGVPEDPATGSAAGPLAVHLARHQRIEYGRQIEIRQGAEIGRPSILQARVDGTSERVERVVVGGSAVLVARGEYRVS
jgi:trans-2,3-dihydro-3-hydroxyanthranilate isomerase